MMEPEGRLSRSWCIRWINDSIIVLNESLNRCKLPQEMKNSMTYRTQFFETIVPIGSKGFWIIFFIRKPKIHLENQSTIWVISQLITFLSYGRGTLEASCFPYQRRRNTVSQSGFNIFRQRRTLFSSSIANYSQAKLHECQAENFGECH